MKYITSIERMGIKQGLKQGLKQGFQQGLHQGLMEGITLCLELKFGKEGVHELHYIKKIHNVEILSSILSGIKTVKTLDELRQMYINQID